MPVIDLANIAHELLGKIRGSRTVMSHSKNNNIPQKIIVDWVLVKLCLNDDKEADKQDITSKAP
jgi:hypothetical protein